ncbi:MAG TPA: glycosyltransferase family 39 protein [Polyangiales bacterium]
MNLGGRQIFASGGRPACAHDHLVGLVLCALYITLLWHTAGDIGLSRDEGIYVDAANNYASWFELLAHDRPTALTRSASDHFFHVNHEHPPLAKMLFALGHLAQEKWQIFPTESLSYRFGGMLSAGLLLWLIYIFGTRLYGPTAGLFAALAYALLPRPFYHAHLDAFDVPITCAVTCVTYAYYRSLSDWRWAPISGVVFGLALLTKHNSWILPGIFALHFVWLAATELYARKRGHAAAVSLVPWGLYAMAVLGPPIFLGGWPWLWHDTALRLQEYAAFHMHHEYYNMEYFGVNYFWPPFPVSYPWVMTLFTVPLTTLWLALAGLGHELGQWWRQLRVLLTRASADALAQPPIDRTQTLVLLLGCCLAPMVIISLPSTPIFGGTKHWFPAYPFFALFAGRTFQLTCELAKPRLSGLSAALRCSFAPVFGALLLLPSAVETAHSHPFGLSHYTAAAGGVPGAADHGMNRQFWGFTTRSLVPFFKQAMPQGGSVYICDTIWTSWQMLSRDGFLPSNIVASFDIAEADYAIVHHEKHFIEVDEQIWTTYGSVKPVYVLRYDGVPIISVYKNPHSRR